MTAVVGAAKRSPPYRRHRGRLGSHCPRDVWLESGLGFVHFDAGDAEWLVFAVDPDTRAVVAAKAIAADESCELLEVVDLLEDAT